MTALPADLVEERAPSLPERMASYDWESIGAALDQDGYAVLPGLLDAVSCGALTALYPAREPFRSRVVMARHGFGSGEYKYFAYPLPELVATLRDQLYARLAPLTNCWNEKLGLETRFPPAHRDFLARCHEAGQTKPTPLLLRYGQGDYNRLHQDLYGEHVFPLQMTVLLSAPRRDFEGGEFVLVEQRPRLQSRAEIVPLGQGDAVIFAVHHRPAKSVRGFHRVALRHGVSRLRAGERFTLGIILHDAG